MHADLSKNAEITQSQAEIEADLFAKSVESKLGLDKDKNSEAMQDKHLFNHYSEYLDELKDKHGNSEHVKNEALVKMLSGVQEKIDAYCPDIENIIYPDKLTDLARIYSDYKNENAHCG